MKKNYYSIDWNSIKFVVTNEYNYIKRIIKKIAFIRQTINSINVCLQYICLICYCVSLSLNTIKISTITMWMYTTYVYVLYIRVYSFILLVILCFGVKRSLLLPQWLWFRNIYLIIRIYIYNTYLTIMDTAIPCIQVYMYVYWSIYFIEAVIISIYINNLISSNLKLFKHIYKIQDFFQFRALFFVMLQHLDRNYWVNWVRCEFFFHHKPETEGLVWVLNWELGVL